MSKHRKGRLTSQLLIESPPGSHWQGLDELRELDASILQTKGRQRENGREEMAQRQDEHLASHSLYFHELLAVLSWCPCCILLKTGPDVCSKSAAIFAPHLALSWGTNMSPLVISKMDATGSSSKKLQHTNNCCIFGEGGAKCFTIFSTSWMGHGG